jgi:peroxiredoxin
MVLVFSGDDGVWLRQVATDEKLPFLLVADTEREVSAAFGVKKPELLPHTFLVGTDKKVVASIGREGGASPAAILKAIPR